jgi:hypothetical protein
MGFPLQGFSPTSRRSPCFHEIVRSYAFLPGPKA